MNIMDDPPLFTLSQRTSRSQPVQALKALEAGQSVTLTYKGKTRFSVWLAVQRQRQGKDFKFYKLAGMKKRQSYKVRLESQCAQAKENEVLNNAPFDPDEHGVNWDNDPLTNEDYAKIVKLADLFRFMPPHLGMGCFVDFISDYEFSRQNIYNVINKFCADSRLPTTWKAQIILREFVGYMRFYAHNPFVQTARRIRNKLRKLDSVLVEGTYHECLDLQKVLRRRSLVTDFTRIPGRNRIYRFDIVERGQ